MRKLSVLLLVFIFCQFNLFAQEGWVQQTSGVNFNLNGVSFTDLNNGTVVGEDEWYGQYSGILRTTNGGENWIQQSVDTSSYFWFSDVFSHNADTVIAVGKRFGDGFPPSAIFRTTNGGEDWENMGGGMCEIYYGVYFSDENNGTVVGGNPCWKDNTKVLKSDFYTGIIFRTTDGGETWIEQSSGTNSALYGVCFTDENNGTVVGTSGTILRTTDGGENWVQQNLSLINHLRCVQFTNQNIGWIGGDGVVLSTTDGGTNWTINQTPGINTTAICFVNESNGWSVANSDTADFGIIQHSTDGGQTWMVQFTVDKHLSAIQFVDEYYGWAVGDSGTILHTSTGGVLTDVLDAKEILVTDFALNQNYPNPFNPTTLIKYQIPKQSLVTLKLYDVLGSEISTLVNEDKTAGTYEISWTAENLPSGVYFYRLQAGDFVETKKMVLLK